MKKIHAVCFLLSIQFFMLESAQLDKELKIEYLFVDGSTPAKFDHAFDYAHEVLNRRLLFGKKRCLQIDVGSHETQDGLKYKRYKDLLNNVSMGDNFDLSLHRESHFFIITEKCKQAN